MRTLGSALVSVLASTLFVSCAPPRPATAVVVQVVPVESVLARGVRTLAFEIQGGPDLITLSSPITEALTPSSWPVLLTLVPREAGERAFRVVVTASDASGAPIAVGRVASRFVLGESRTAIVLLDDRCTGCNAAQTCVNAACEPAERAPDELLDYAGRIDAAVSYDAGAGVDASVEPRPCEPADVPPESDAIFVSVDGGSDTNDGTRARPVRTLAHALEIREGRSVVALAPGRYEERVTLGEVGGELTLRGGFAVAGSSWTRDCGATASGLARVASPERVAIDASRFRASLALETLTIEAQPGSPGTSMAAAGSSIGVQTGPNVPSLRIVGATIRSGVGGAGVPGANGEAGTRADRASVCTSPARDGAVGIAGANGRVGSFSDVGYTPTRAENGQIGMPGTGGTPAPSPPTRSCVATCSGTGRPSTDCYVNESATRMGNPGQCGLGGLGGAGGEGGGGGGLSAGVYASGPTRILLEGATIHAAVGGEGGAGGMGGEGASGSLGQAGAPAVACPTACRSCVEITGCTCTPNNETGTPLVGTAGGPGARGGRGGQGGGGAGGPSYAIVARAGARVEGETSSSLAADGGGLGGVGGSGERGPTGASAPIGSVP